MKSLKYPLLAGCLLIGCVFLTSVPGVPKATPGTSEAQVQQSSPRIINAKMKGSKIIILGENFNSETVVLINGQPVKTIVDSESPTSILVAKKIHKVTPVGVEARLQTKNPIGEASEAFDFFLGQTILIDDAGKTITLQVGERVMLVLQKDAYEWKPHVENSLILQKVQIFTTIKGQGIYEAKQPGATTINATGELPCSKETPPCLAPALEFHVNIVVQ